jgi:muramidase (phage lysozyme)
MAENNLGSSEQIDNLNQTFTNTISELSSDNSSLNVVESARKNAALSLKKEKEAREALLNATGNTIKDLYSFGKSLSNGSGSAGFESLNKIIGTTAKLMGGLASAIPVVGDAFQGIIEGAAEVAKFLTGQFSKAYGNFEKLSGTGVISTFQDLKEASKTIGLTFSDTEKVLTTYSRELANFTGSALTGRKRLQDIAYETKNISESFQIIGIDAAEFADMQLSYISQQQRTANGKNLTDRQLAAGSVQYIEQLDTLSKLTGISRKDLQEQLMERNRNARYLAGISGLEPTIKKNIDKMISQFSALDSEFSEGMQDLIASGGAPTTDKAKAALLALGQGGMNVEEEIKKLKKGGNPAEFYSLSTNALKKYGSQMKGLIKYIGSDNMIGKAFIASQNAQNLSQAELIKIEEDINKKRNGEINNTNSEAAKLAATRRSMYNTTKNIDLLATGSEMMSSIMNKMAGGIEDVVGKIYEFLGDESGMPEYLKLRKQERISINKSNKLKKELADDIKRQAEIKEKIIQIDKNPNSPENRGKKLQYTRALETINSQIAIQEEEIKLQEVNVKKVTVKRIEADRAAGMGATVGAPRTTTSATSGSTSGTRGKSGTSDTSGNNGSSPDTTGARLETMTGTGSGRGLSVIRELISSVESVGGSYDSIFGGSTSTPLTAMTISQVLNHQQQMINRGAKSTAAGKYQFIMGSLREYAAKLNMDINSTMFNAATQDALADVLIKEKGYDSYKSGKITAAQFLDRLSRAWAGLPSPSKGGQSFYGGDGLNRSHISIQKALDQIGQARTGGIFRGPSTGYLAMLHGDEAVIPANPGSSELDFSTSFNSDETEIVNVFSMITDKVDRMIKLNRNLISIQRKFTAYGVK